MTYIMCINVLMLIQIVTMSKAFNRSLSGEITQQQAMKTYLIVMPTLLIASPLVLQIARAFTGELSLDQRGYFIWFLGAGAIYGIASFGYQLMRARQTAASPMAIGGMVLGALISAYMLVVVVDHARFFADDEDAGMISWSFFHQTNDVPEIECDSDVMVVRGLHDDAVTYRCPTKVIFGAYTGQPFVPWPSYTEGTSTQLSKAMNKLHQNTIQIETTQKAERQ